MDSLASLVSAINNRVGAATLFLASSGSPYLVTSEILVNRSVAIQPEDADGFVTLDAQACTRIFRISAGNVSLSRLVLRNGLAHTVETVDHDETMLSGVRGGAILALPGVDLQLAECQLLGNIASALIQKGVVEGGAICSLGRLELFRCVIEANRADAKGARVIAMGGGISCWRDLRMLHCCVKVQSACALQEA